MGEGITTRIQRELTALKATIENITIEMRSNHEKLRLETQQYTDDKFLEARAYADARHFELTEKLNRIFSLLTGKEFDAYETPYSGYRSDAIGSIRNTAANTTTQLESIDAVSSNRSSVTTIDEHQEVVNILDRGSGPVDFEGTIGSNFFIHNFDRSCVGSEYGDAIVDIDDRKNQSRVDVAVIKTVPNLVKCEDDGSVIVVTRDLCFVSMIETAKCELEKEVIGSHVKIIADELKIEFANYEMHEWHNPCDRRYDPEKVADDDPDSFLDVYDRLISPLHNYLSVEPLLIIQLPRRSEISYAMDKNGEYDAAFPAGLKILIVDDDRTCLFVLEAMLRKLSYQVTKSQNARDALGLLRQHKNRFDLVMCDLHVSGMDGLKLLEIIRSEMDLPFVMVSSDDRKEAIMKDILDGVCQYLVKPVKMEEARLIWQHVVRKRVRKHMLGDFQQPAKNIYNTLSQQAKDTAHQMPAARDKGDGDEEEDNLREYSSDDVTNAKKQRVIWSIELHGVFVAAVNQLGRDKAVPKKILERMQAMDVTGLCTGLSRANIASHLQKYRLHLRRGQPSTDNRDINPLFEQASSFGHQSNLQYEPTTGHQLPLQNMIINQQPIIYQRAYEDLSAYHTSHHDQVSYIYADSFVPELVDDPKQHCFPMAKLHLCFVAPPYFQTNVKPIFNHGLVCYDNNSQVHGVSDMIVGVLGGGQLGRMLCQAVSKLVFKVMIVDHMVGSFDDNVTVQEFAKRCGVLTVEIEHVDVATLKKLEKQKVHCEPRASTVPCSKTDI